ncbi:Nif3-like dinuclear metal center hexameric protein [Demequina sp. TTPB684]|uniref:Nif3-like dinuclear metal center hexameric protein n=1 Tax=unclassified Demequina TaxID=2620311 RepID=UPI001CF3EF9D|nr:MULTISPECIES: Nif3-like dinuclear metal center hexameric protein [unclassified Demequina]MCB2414044.1 Nif3-like dinuclear metal center hexameric protein [Demequina sp. TTPB684]UPU89077.1 Nif3-like dinuclear metal center hexameric protein [Demequina sp. TMPB413]
MTTVADVVAWLERRYPPRLAEAWDAPGLAVGDPARDVRHVRFAVDPTLEVIREAIAAGADLLITHHPLMLRGVTSVAANTVKGAAVHALVKGGCAQLAAHTNADAAADGVADALAQALGVRVEGPLVAASGEPHPVGSGRVGTIEPTSLKDFAAVVAAALPATAAGVLYSGDADGVITTVAVVGGSGDAYLADAAAAGVDAYVTADLRHHPASEAREAALLDDGRPYLINVSHAASESLWLAAAASELAEAFSVTTSVSTLNTDPWTGRAPSPSFKE